MYLIAALGAAVLFALSTVLKHRTAQAVGTARDAGAAGLRGVVTQTLRHPAWLVGIGVDVGALGLQIVALHLGPIAVVQPLLAVSVVVALLFDRGRGRSGAWRWACLLVAGLAAFVTFAGATATAATPDGGPALIVALSVAAVLVLCLAAAKRLHVGLTAATTLGVGVGISYAASAALLKVLSYHAVTNGLLTLLTSWQLYAVVACGAVGVLLNQLAFSAGPLRHSLPTISVVDPLVSVGLGIAVFDERFRVGSWYGVAQAAALVAIVVAIVKIGRARVSTEPDRNLVPTG